MHAVVEIRAHFSLGDQIVKISVRGADEAEMGRPGFAGTHGSVGFSFQNAQQFDLHGGGEFSHLIEEQRAPVCGGYETFLAGNGTRESALHMTEKFALHQRFRNGPAIDRHEMPLPAAQQMQRAGGKVFSCSCLPVKDGGGLAARGQADLFVQQAHGLAVADHAAETSVAFSRQVFQALVFPPELQFLLLFLRCVGDMPFHVQGSAVVSVDAPGFFAEPFDGAPVRAKDAVIEDHRQVRPDGFIRFLLDESQVFREGALLDGVGAEHFFRNDPENGEAAVAHDFQTESVTAPGSRPQDLCPPGESGQAVVEAFVEGWGRKGADGTHGDILFAAEMQNYAVEPSVWLLPGRSEKKCSDHFFNSVPCPAGRGRRRAGRRGADLPFFRRGRRR